MQQQQKAEDRKLENTVENLQQRINEIKSSLNQFLWKLDHEHEFLSWTGMLDNFALLSSQISSFQKLLASDRIASMKNFSLIPLMLSQDRDSELERITEGRLAVFNHEIVPDYLRSKPEMDVEEKLLKITDKSSTIAADAANKQINSLTRMCTNLLAQIQNKREEWRNEEGQRKLQESFSSADTLTLVAATTFGKGLQDRHTLGLGPLRVDSTPSQAVQPQRTAPLPNINMTGPGKLPSSVKPNIRVHSQLPYQRP